MLASLFVPLSVQGTELKSLSQLVQAHFTWGADAAGPGVAQNSQPRIPSPEFPTQVPISGGDAGNTGGTTG